MAAAAPHPRPPHADTPPALPLSAVKYWCTPLHTTPPPPPPSPSFSSYHSSLSSSFRSFFPFIFLLLQILLIFFCDYTYFLFPGYVFQLILLNILKFFTLSFRIFIEIISLVLLLLFRLLFVLMFYFTALLTCFLVPFFFFTSFSPPLSLSLPSSFIIFSHGSNSRLGGRTSLHTTPSFRPSLRGSRRGAELNLRPLVFGLTDSL